MRKNLLEKWAHRTRRGMVITAPVGATIVVAALLLIVLEIFVLRWYLHPQTQAEKKDFAQAAATVAAGIVLLGQMFLAGLNLQVTRDSANQKAESDREGQITERYTRAVEQLGSDAMAIRLGGIFALERIARDSPKDHWAIVNLLTTFVKDHCFSEVKREILLQNVRAKRNDKGTPPDQFWRLDQEEVNLMHAGSSTHNDIRVVLEVVGRRDITCDGPDGPGPLNFAGIVMRGFSFMEHYERAGFFGSTLHGTVFISTHLEGASFQDARLFGVRFLSVVMDRTDFTGAFFEDVFFERTDLRGAKGLTQWHINQCRFFGDCTLPSGFHWPGELPPGSPVSTG